ncbi:hypothetical protein EO98_15115 [Methanosarcina sp. 2.H.T.1A.6]|uniref:hypothetical protein n=1 Tax=unclassified Methanosarcina TaxID=2644672 RepID=UPI0006221B87|nr:MULTISPECIES: hypothetical protein [unclassified Methanosarcina]KKG15885.1 hypothetical protein EO97_14265 [Methanosarcina sp. 2.H.T.1A.15]KKG16705.1 hypothetical protein EO94_00535 [Methanosarcina sp. 2.H.T.1A.3]KKG22836.1 hypothetical protein EO98_15115 [Methanosarcina sp. 2.H.T.1A.6]KKG24434.1 hypothetical protein EO96_14750 [Methanosarcina sp. 2.H.T.1A.8]
MAFGSETSFGTYGHMLNTMLVFLLASFIVLMAMFAYTKYGAKKSQETKLGTETERELIKAEKEREEARKTEETGYSERDERDENENDDSDADGE